MNKELAIKLLRSSVLGTNEQLHEAVFMAIRALKAEPKHGRWEMYGAFTRGTLTIPIYRCSECKEDTNNWFWHYCPNCGARMDGGENG